MAKMHCPYPAEFRDQMVALVRSGRSPGELNREFEPCAQTFRNWVYQMGLDAGRRGDGLTTLERDELRKFRWEILTKATAWFARETD